MLFTMLLLLDVTVFDEDRDMHKTQMLQAVVQLILVANLDHELSDPHCPLQVGCNMIKCTVSCMS